MSAGAAAQYGLHIGSTLRIAFFTKTRRSNRTSELPEDNPYLIVPFKLVGIVEWSPQVVQDDDAALGNQIAVITPALTKRLQTCCAFYTSVMLHLDGGLTHEAGGRLSSEQDHPQPRSRGRCEHERPPRWAEPTRHPAGADRFGAFGLIAALAAPLDRRPGVGRLVRPTLDDGEVLRALGAGPAMTT